MTITITNEFIATVGLVTFGLWFCGVAIFHFFERYL